MEPLTRNYDLKPTYFSAIPAKFPKLTSLVFDSRRSSSSSSSNRHHVNQKWKVSLSVQANSSGRGGFMESVAKKAFGFGASTALFFSVFSDSPAALAESLTVAFPVSRAPEVF